MPLRRFIMRRSMRKDEGWIQEQSVCVTLCCRTTFLGENEERSFAALRMTRVYVNAWEEFSTLSGLDSPASGVRCYPQFQLVAGAMRFQPC